MIYSEIKWYGGTSKLDGAGTPLYTLPDKSNVEPWQGQKKPPSQSKPNSEEFLFGLYNGEQPRWVQIPNSTKNSGLIERYLFFVYVGWNSPSDFGSLK